MKPRTEEEIREEFGYILDAHARGLAGFDALYTQAKNLFNPSPNFTVKQDERIPREES